MKSVLLLSLCALALFWNACEKQPLEGDPQPGIHAEHDAEKHDAKAPAHQEPAQPADEAKAQEAPKFFPEKK